MTGGTVERRRHGRWFDLTASVLIGIVLVGAALVPAATASSGETTTIRGDVTIDGQRVPFFPVGFWAPSDPTSPVTSTTDANGVFTLDVPATTDGYAYAGTTPDSSEGIISVGGREVVRGIIGAKAATPISTPLYAGWQPTTAKSLAGGAKQLHFLLQGPGRIGGTSPVRGSALRGLQVRRLDGSVVESLRADSRGRFTSEDLAPGNYLVAAIPRSPMLPSTVQVAVTAGTTATAALPAPVQGATIDGTVDLDSGGAAPGGVPVLLEQDDLVLQRTTTGSGGAYRFTGVSAGDYTVDVGRYAASDASGTSAAATTVPLPTPTPTGSPSTPAPTATAPTPSPSPSQQVLQPVVRTADAVLPATSDVAVTDVLGDVAVTTTVSAAARLRGTVSGADGSPVQVVVEDADSGRVLRTATVSSDGGWSVGGLTSGVLYTVWAVTSPDDLSTARMGTTTGLATASTSGIDVVLDRPAATLQGSVASATGGSVRIGDSALLSRTVTVDASGAYSVAGLVPGLYPATVTAPKRLLSDAVPVQVAESGSTIDLQRGPEQAVWTGWFISAGAGVPLVSGTASSTAGSTIRFGPVTDGGHVTVDGLRPGTYQYDGSSFAGTAPVSDGPWWFGAPSGTFSLSDGAKTDVGPIVLHVHARL